MPYYVNPRNGETKEEFLSRVGREIAPVSTLKDLTGEQRLVVWKNNVIFTAAGVVTGDRDLVESFQSPADHRETRYYVVPQDALRSVISEREWENLVQEQASRTE